MLFVGDAGTRQIFWATLRKLDAGFEARERAARNQAHADIDFAADGVALRFVWDPWLNSSALLHALGAAPPPALVLVGGGLFHARHGAADAVRRFQDAVDAIAAAAYPRRLPHREAVWSAPVLEPQYDRLSPSREHTILPDKIAAMNRHLARQRLPVLWSFARMTAGRPAAYTESGLHGVQHVAQAMADVVLNLRCNADAARRAGAPVDRPLRWLQLVGAIVAAGLALVAMTGLHARARLVGTVAGERRSVAAAAAAPGVTRVASWPRQRRGQPRAGRGRRSRHSAWRLFRRRACGRRQRRSQRTAAVGATRRGDRAAFLSRAQADKCKGWMQVYMLVYGYTGAAAHLELYEVFRLLHAAYILLSAYGRVSHEHLCQESSGRRMESDTGRRRVGGQER